MVCDWYSRLNLIVGFCAVIRLSYVQAAFVPFLESEFITPQPWTPYSTFGDPLYASQSEHFSRVWSGMPSTTRLEQCAVRMFKYTVLQNIASFVPSQSWKPIVGVPCRPRRTSFQTAALTMVMRSLIHTRWYHALAAPLQILTSVVLSEVALLSMGILD